MLIIGCDFRTRYQQIAMANGEGGELLLERRLAGRILNTLLGGRVARATRRIPQEG